MLNSMIMEAGYRSREQGKLKDEYGEYEWVELEDFETGKPKKVKKYKDPKVV